MHLQNTLEQFLHEAAGPLLVVSLPRNKLFVTPGGLTWRTFGQERQYA
jgi:hypothetical protein